MKFRIVFIILIISKIDRAKAQDPIFSQSNYLQETLNPGFSGFEDNDRIYAGTESEPWQTLEKINNTSHSTH